MAALADLPVIGPYAISEEDLMGGNVCCSKCLTQWLRDGVDWRTNPVHIVTIHEGNSLCVEHLREALGLPSEKHDD